MSGDRTVRALLIVVFSSVLAACAAPKAPEPEGDPLPINPVYEVEHGQSS